MAILPIAVLHTRFSPLTPRHALWPSAYKTRSRLYAMTHLVCRP